MTTHGESHRTKEYIAWKAMRQRCNYPKHPQFSDYGGRGIQVCERWNRYETFLADMGRKPSPQHWIDRWPDNDGNYEPGNCRWATPKQNNNNRRHRKLRKYCRHGLHLMSPENIIWDGVHRRCLACRRISSRKPLLRRKPQLVS